MPGITTCGVDRARDREMRLAAGTTDYLVKPLSPGALLEQAYQMLELVA